MIKEWFYNNVYQPVSKFCRKYILRETEQQDDAQNMVTEQQDVQGIVYDAEETQPPVDNDII